ncbi:hypothetical protein J8Z82_14565 [Yersinia enterocolitica]|uniref:hypothetical protein n=1 Tax=Yersinia enterocolitica TaxID=630 RepID=UPI001C8E2E29|nr:hypothetical protein [Yersinia enterocolitica]MBX9488801.1 hypothetical protein [Yersinia enterocolitica]MBX9492997.1 hypothetical protein [Yersinia enterocolitica]
MTGEIKTGGPAFPFVPGEGSALYESEGMQLRDYMAAKYMQGVSANPEKLYDDDNLAKEAYLMADAMIKARG